MSDDKEIRWAVTNPYNHEVILKQETYDKHIDGDHSEADAKVRRATEEQTKSVIKNPRYIVRDTNSGDRYQYIDVLPMESSGKQSLRMFKTIVDVSRYPHEVVTWMPVRNGIRMEGGIVYDSTRGIIEK